MKQHINKKQWEEVTRPQQATFNGIIESGSIYTFDEDKKPSIGQMIEFLGEDLIIYPAHSKQRGVDFYEDGEDEPHCFVKPELVDALFEAVKFKLNG